MLPPPYPGCCHSCCPGCCSCRSTTHHHGAKSTDRSPVADIDRPNLWLSTQQSSASQRHGSAHRSVDASRGSAMSTVKLFQRRISNGKADYYAYTCRSACSRDGEYWGLGDSMGEGPGALRGGSVSNCTIKYSVVGIIASYKQ